MTVLSPVQETWSKDERKQAFDETRSFEQNKKLNIDDITVNLEVRKREIEQQSSCNYDHYILNVR